VIFFNIANKNGIYERMELVKKGILVMLVLLIVSILVVLDSSMESAVFINVKPTLQMNDVEYLVTEDEISKDKIEKQVGRVTQIILLVSYLEENNPYKKPSKIYKIKDKEIEDEVALEMNNKFYIARFNGAR